MRLPRQAATEREFQTAVQQALATTGWWWMHVRRMRTPDGRWLTGTSEPGWPDLTAMRLGHLLAIEVKSATGRTTPAQRKVLNRLHETGAMTWVLNPADDLQVVTGWLARPATAPPVHGWEPGPC